MKKKLIVFLALAMAVTIVFAGIAIALTDPVVYGMSRLTGDIYAINPTTGETELAYTALVPAYIAMNSPNGLAYDGPEGRLYYTDYWGPTNLWFWDGGTDQTLAGVLTGDVACATFANGDYYYIAGGGNDKRTDDFHRVVLDANGYVVSDTKLSDLTDNDRGWYFDGDIAYNSADNCIYGWGGYGTYTYEFFKINLGDLSFTTILDLGYVPKWSLQLAFGQDGVLYGHRAYGTGEFYSVDLATGATTLTATGCLDPADPTGETYLQFTDLSSAPSGGQIAARISGSKWNDEDGEGDWDPAELGLPNWTITLYKSSDGGSTWDYVSEVLTNPLGGYSFDDLGMGLYKVQESAQEGWEPTFPTADYATNYYLVTIDGLGNVSVNPTKLPTALDFGNTEEGGGGQILPTGVSPADFASGVYPTFEEYYPGGAQYSVKKGELFQVNPGVFFYYAWADLPAGPFSITVSQTNTGTWRNIEPVMNSVDVFDASAAKIRGTSVSYDPISGDVTLTGSVPAAGEYIVMVKYSLNSLTGYAPGTPSTVTYTMGGDASFTLSPK